MIQRSAHAPFRFATIDELARTIELLGLDIPIEQDTSFLTCPVSIAGRTIPNSMAVHPMEGCDGADDGAPGPLTFRRYKRFAQGGAGLLWFEACAVVPEGRANPRQLWITRANRDEFARLLTESLNAAPSRPFTVLQLTHSGRYSRPIDAARPVIAHHDPILDADRGIPADYPLITDDELERLEDAYVEAAKLAFEVGFDAVDIKSCHRYLMNELLAAHTREGRYGGSYENRTRLLRNVVGKVMAVAPPGGIVTCRLGIHDAHPYPHGWGMSATDPMRPDLTEPKRLVRELSEMGMPVINITMGNPYFNPHVNRPYDRPTEGGVYPDEHPLVGVARLTGLTRELQAAVPEIAVVGSGFSWLRNLWPYVASACLRDGAMRMVGLGRQSFAYPGFAREIIETGKLERRHTCIGCSGCTQIMRDGGTTGCVPFDSEVYGPIYRAGRRASLDYVKAQAARCRDCFDPTCRDGCPAGVDIPGFVTALASGDIRKSYEILRQSNALPEMCAYVCPAEVQCQASCVENVFSGNPVPIRELQLYVCRAARKSGWTADCRRAFQSPNPTECRRALQSPTPLALSSPEGVSKGGPRAADCGSVRQSPTPLALSSAERVSKGGPRVADCGSVRQSPTPLALSSAERVSKGGPRVADCGSVRQSPTPLALSSAERVSKGGPRVAVIGAGPAGLACASSLAAMGHEVHVFDPRQALGGVAASAIPDRRLLRDDSDSEALDVLGDDVAIHGGALSPERNLDWFTSRFDAVFLAVGLSGSVSLEDSPARGRRRTR